MVKIVLFLLGLLAPAPAAPQPAMDAYTDYSYTYGDMPYEYESTPYD
jgi:hypothetical protein